MYLTKGAIQSILNGDHVVNPILRISNLKSFNSDKGGGKVRLNLTDGVSSHSYVLLNSQLNEKVDSGELKHGSIVQLDNYVKKTQGNKDIIMIVGLTILTEMEAENIAPNASSDTLKINAIVDTKTTYPVIKQSPSMSSSTVCVPISLLNPYQNKWTIKGRVIQKDRIKTWSKPNNEGKLFSFTIADDSCDVRITAFNAEVEKYHDLIEIDKTYTLSKGIVKPANRQFNSTKCDHEITLKSDSEIQEVMGDEVVPAMKYDFVTIANIKELSPNSKVDVVAIGHEIKETSSITVKATNKEVAKRDIVLVDRSGCSINATLWGEDVKTLDNIISPIIVIRGAIVKDFGGRSLNVSNSSMMKINPTDVPEAETLLGWYHGGGRDGRFDAQTSGAGGFKPAKIVTISELSCISGGDKGEYFTVNAHIANIKKENLVYKACGKCNKKVVDLNNGLYNCERCNVESPDFKYRLMLNINIIDHTSSSWVTAFQETAEKILGKSAETIGQYTEQEDKEVINNLVSSVLYAQDLVLRLRVVNDTYNDETRMKVTLNECSVRSIEEEIASISI